MAARRARGRTKRLAEAATALPPALVRRPGGRAGLSSSARARRAAGPPVDERARQRPRPARRRRASRAAVRGRVGHLGRPAADQQARQALGAKRVHRVERGRSPRSSPMKTTDGRRRSATSARSAPPLSTPGGRSSRTSRPGSTTSPVSLGQLAQRPRSRRRRPAGSAARRVCTATRAALVLDPGALGRRERRRAAPGSRARAAMPRSPAAGVTRPPLPALQPVVTEDDEPGTSAARRSPPRARPVGR